MAVGNGPVRRLWPPRSWLVDWSEAPEGQHTTRHYSTNWSYYLFSFFFFFLFCISYLLTYIYIYIFFLHLEDIDIPIVPIWIQVWSLSHRNVSFIQFQVQDLVCCCNCTQMSLLCYLLCVFLLCALVQGLLLYPDDRGYAGRPPQFPPEDVFAELGRVHASPAGAHDFKTSLL